MGDIVGFLDRFKRGPSVEPDNLKLPSHIEVPAPYGRVKKGPMEHAVEVTIVGESHYQENIKAINQVAQGQTFEFYLSPEYNNPFDKNAMGVMVAELQVGYISRDHAKQWRQFHMEALQRGEYLWGEARAFSRDGAIFGVFGKIWMPRLAQDFDISQGELLTESRLVQLISQVKRLADSEDPSTIAQAKSLAGKAEKVAVPLARHANASIERGINRDYWEEILDLCHQVLDEVSSTAYLLIAEDSSVLGSILDLEEALDRRTSLE